MNKISEWFADRIGKSLHRQLLVVSGDQDWVQHQATELLQTIKRLTPDAKTLSCGALKTDVQTDNKSYSAHLGKEYSHVVYDASSQFRLNAFAALSGTVAKHGLMVLLTPNLSNWPNSPNDELLNRVSYGYESEIKESLYLQFFRQQLEQDPHVYKWSTEGLQGLPAYIEQEWHIPTDGVPTEDQEQVIAAVIKVATGHRKRPLVLRADRGRGKSAALGMSIRQLLAMNKRIAVCAPTRDSVQTLFKFAQNRQTLSTKCQFYAVDDLIQNEHDIDVVVIDEAASIPIHLLKLIIQKYHRVVLSSTIHGYEGTGRGFDVRFIPYLSKIRPGLRKLNLNQPIRWCSGDSLEDFVWRVCQLKAIEWPSSGSTIEAKDLVDIPLQLIDKRQLLSNPLLLNQLFLLLVEAHYQTSPDDLLGMLDAPEQHIFVYQKAEVVLGVILVNKEGQIGEEKLSLDIAHGNRRVSGHLLPQQLSFVSGSPNWNNDRYLRIIRIAVSANARRYGIGKKMLADLEVWSRHQHVDYIGSAFGASSDLLAFWKQSNYQIVHLGFHKDKSSAEHSVIVMKSLAQDNGEVRSLINVTKSLFTYHLSGLFRQLDPHIVLSILKDWAVVGYLNEKTKTGLQLFVRQNRQLQLIEPLLPELLNTTSTYDLLDIDELTLLTRLSMQKWPSSDIVREYKLNGKKDFTTKLKTALAKLLIN